MKIARISLLLLIVAVVIVSGCKAAQEPVTVTEQTAPSEQVVDSGLQELDEIDSLAEETDLGLEEIEKMELE